MTAGSITPHEFVEFEKTNSRSAYNEWLYCLDPKFTKYRIVVNNFLTNNVFPTYRLAKSGTQLTSIFQDREATPISFVALARRPELIESLLSEGFISTNDTVLAYHCSTCGVRVVKDGIHRLCKWAVEGSDREITVYEVSSRDWARAPVDMQNYCACRK
jgi:hypothetical protein